jgi:lysyl-tRNA synthetase, class I
VRDELPAEAVAGLDDDQRRYLGRLAETDTPLTSGEAWQDRIFSVAGEEGLPNGRAFAAIYAAFLGRANGPRAGWLLASLDRGFVLDRLRAAAGQVPA